jgi:hypothetical protein
MRKHLALFFVVIALASCQKDEFDFEYNNFDPASGVQILYIDSMRVNSFVFTGFCHVDRSKIVNEPAIKSIVVFRNGVERGKIPYQNSLERFAFYDNAVVTTGNYTYEMRFIAEDGEQSKPSNTFTIFKP